MTNAVTSLVWVYIGSVFSSGFIDFSLLVFCLSHVLNLVMTGWLRP